jgi:prolyl oligopeptidase
MLAATSKQPNREMLTMSNADPRPTLAAPDDDPWIWLEGIEAPESIAWVEARNAKTFARFGDASFTRDRDALAAIYDRPENIPFVTRRGATLFNFWKDAANPRGLWRTTTLESYRSDSPEWEILLDLDALAEAEGEDWIWGEPRPSPAATTARS